MTPLAGASSQQPDPVGTDPARPPISRLTCNHGSASTRRSYFADLRTTSPAGGCVNNRDGSFTDRPAGTRVRAVLDPSRGEGGPTGWCPGLLRGRVTYSEGFACPPRGVCHPPPHFPQRTVIVARFTVRVG